MDPEKQKTHYVNYLQCITLWPLSQWVSGVVSNFSAISRRKQVTFRRDDFDVVLVQQAVDFTSASSLKQQPVGCSSRTYNADSESTSLWSYS